MDSLLIYPENEEDLKLLKELLSKMKIKTKVLTEEEKEDMGLAYLMSQADRSETVSKDAIFKKLSDED